MWRLTLLLLSNGCVSIRNFRSIKYTRTFVDWIRYGNWILEEAFFDFVIFGLPNPFYRIPNQTWQMSKSVHAFSTTSTYLTSVLINYWLFLFVYYSKPIEEGFWLVQWYIIIAIISIHSHNYVWICEVSDQYLMLPLCSTQIIKLPLRNLWGANTTFLSPHPKFRLQVLPIQYLSSITIKPCFA